MILTVLNFNHLRGLSAVLPDSAMLLLSQQVTSQGR